MTGRRRDRGAVRVEPASGASVDTEVVELTGKFSNEIGACFQLIRRVRERVDAARRAGAFPVVLSGSCCVAALGVVAAMDEREPGVVWFDAHGDFNTPETTTFGYFDGMGLSVLTGSAWQAMYRTVPGAKPLPESAIVLADRCGAGDRTHGLRPGMRRRGGVCRPLPTGCSGSYGTSPRQLTRTRKGRDFTASRTALRRWLARIVIQPLLRGR